MRGGASSAAQAQAQLQPRGLGAAQGPCPSDVRRRKPVGQPGDALRQPASDRASACGRLADSTVPQLGGSWVPLEPLPLTGQRARACGAPAQHCAGTAQAQRRYGTAPPYLRRRIPVGQPGDAAAAGQQARAWLRGGSRRTHLGGPAGALVVSFPSPGPVESDASRPATRRVPQVRRCAAQVRLPCRTCAVPAQCCAGAPQARARCPVRGRGSSSTHEPPS
jgi:hypothetical protein